MIFFWLNNKLYTNLDAHEIRDAIHPKTPALYISNHQKQTKTVLTYIVRNTSTASIFVGTLRCISTSANKDTSFNQIHHKPPSCTLYGQDFAGGKPRSPKNNNCFFNSN